MMLPDQFANRYGVKPVWGIKPRIFTFGAPVSGSDPSGLTPTISATAGTSIATVATPASATPAPGTTVATGDPMFALSDVAQAIAPGATSSLSGWLLLAGVAVLVWLLFFRHKGRR